MARASFHAVGCKLNTYELEMLTRQFAGAGYEIVPFGQPADVTVINTCTVTERADSDCRNIIRRARRAGDSLIVATGCLAERTPEQLADMPEVGLVVDNGGKTSLISDVEAHIRPGCEPAPAATPKSEPDEFLTIHPASEARDDLLTRATLQVQDGCDERCTYCIIPSVRGASRSRPLPEIEQHARTLARLGYREIALTGVNTGSYGFDTTNDVRLAGVLRAIAAVEGIARVRVNSIEPNTLGGDLIDALTGTPKMCRHYHIPLQSGADSVLKRMGRRYRTDDYRRVVKALHDRQPDAAFGADVMVGFPSETESEFEETLRFVEEVPLTYLHVFSYSPRDGTPATKLDEQHTRAVKDARSQALRELGARKRDDFHRRHVGRAVEVLVEDSRDPATGRLRGLTDNYIRVAVDAPADAVNRILPVRIVEAMPEGALGSVVTPESGAE